MSTNYQAVDAEVFAALDAEKGVYACIEEECFSESADGPFRSLHLSAEGHSVEEMELSATISEIDQDGGECESYALSDVGGKNYELAMSLIRSVQKKAQEDFDPTPNCSYHGNAKCDCGPRAAND